MGTSALVAAVIAAAVIGAGTAVYTSDQSRKAAHEGQDQAKAQAEKQVEMAAKTAASGEEATNRVNARTPNASTILSAAQQAAKGGVGGTMLTGPTGVTPDQLQLGKTSLLGS